MPMPKGMTPEVIQYVIEMTRREDGALSEVGFDFHDNGALSIEMARREKVQLALMKHMIEGEVGSLLHVTETLAVAADGSPRKASREALVRCLSCPWYMSRIPSLNCTCVLGVTQWSALI